MKFFHSAAQYNKFRKKLLVGVVPILLLAALAGLSFLFQQPLTSDQRFRAFTRQIFCTELSGSTLNLHYTLSDPSAYDLADSPVSLGSMSRSGWNASAAQAENYLALLQTFPREQLSPQNRLTWDILSDYLQTQQQSAPYYLYQEPLSSTLGIQAQLPVLLAEYTFRTRKDIDQDLQLLTMIPDYFHSVMDFEREKVAAGLFMNDICLTKVLEQCDAFVRDSENHYLKQIFDEQIDSFTNLTADEKISYKKQNRDIIDTYVIPAYRELMNDLASLLGNNSNSGGLCHFPQGKSYYEYLVRSTTGDDSPISQLEERIKKEVVSAYSNVQTLLQTEELTSISLDNITVPDPEEIMVELRQAVSADFPTAPEVSCKVKYIHGSLKDHLSPAFYLIPPLDDTGHNVIYVNPASKFNALELYTTLAHEGYPGHLYQTVTFENSCNDPVRSVLNFGGYTEGWATYAEMYAYSTWQENPTLASIYRQDRSLMLGLASLLDIGIHYHGYSRVQVRQFLGKFGITEQSADALYTNILEAPANYLKYYVGYLNFTDLQTTLKETLGEQFSLKEYHARVMAIGPCSFPVLKHYLTDTDFLASCSAAKSVQTA